MSQALFLRVYRNGQLQGVKQFQGDQVVLGTEESSDLRLEAGNVSAIHAMIEKRGNNYYLCDLGSEQGTSKNGTLVLDEEIVSGDEIQIGDYSFEFFIGIPKPKSQPPPLKPSSQVPPEPPKEELAPPTAPNPPKASPATTPPAPVSQPPVAPKAETKSETKPEVKPEAKPAAPKAPPVVPKTEMKPAPVTVKPVVSEVKPAVASKPTVPVQPATPSPKVPASKPKPTSPISMGGLEKATSAGGGKSARQVATRVLGVKKPSERIKPSKGTVLEVALVWGDNVVNTYHFNEKRMVTVGTHPKNDIMLPLLMSAQSSHGLIKLDGIAQIFLLSNMNGELVRPSGSTPLAQLIAGGKLQKSGANYVLVLQQEELVKLDLGDKLFIYVRYVSPSSKPIGLPILDLTPGEMLALITSALVVLVGAFFINMFTPKDVEQPNAEADPPRAVKFTVVKVPPPPKAPTPAVEVGGSPQPDPKKVASQKETVPIPLPKEKPAEAAPNNSKSKEKKMTAANKGNSGGSAGPKKPDVSKTGILSVFGKSGTMSQLEKAISGSGSVAGMGKQATGSAGMGAGNNKDATGPGLRDVGAGGKGVAPVGISGVNTAGRGGGQYGYGDESLGGKGKFSIVPGGAEESFTGTIDREAIRRVIKENEKQLRTCYERGLNRNPGLYGKIILSWVIGNLGRVMEAHVASSTMGSQEVEQCLLARLKSWRFPEPPPGQEAEVRFPFVFSAQK